MKTILCNKNLFIILSMFLLSSVSAQTAFKGLDESLVNVLPANEFDFAGTWTAYIYSVEYDKEAESVSRFEVIDSVHSVFYHRLIGFRHKLRRVDRTCRFHLFDFLLIKVRELIVFLRRGLDRPRMPKRSPHIFVHELPQTIKPRL